MRKIVPVKLSEYNLEVSLRRTFLNRIMLFDCPEKEHGA